MNKFIIQGPTKLKGEIAIAGAKNVALKALVASLLTDEPLTLQNIPNIGDVQLMLEVLRQLGIKATMKDHVVTTDDGHISESFVPLEIGARLRTSSMVLGPMLARFGSARIPNPGGCRLGARPIDRHIDGLRQMGAEITYHSDDGYFYAKAEKLHGADITFTKNTHTGTETLLLAAVLAQGKTILRNSAEEVEVDDLISLLTAMGANINRTQKREIMVSGVKRLHGTTYKIMPDRNEEVTWAVGAAASGGSILVKNSQLQHLTSFLEVFNKAGGIYEEIDENTTRYSSSGHLKAVDVTTQIHPGFMTDWQAPWAILMTQATGVSTIHETVFESRFSYVEELKKMGAHISYFDPEISNPKEYYNFNLEDRVYGTHQAIRITGPTPLHNAVLMINDLRAGATLLLASLIATGESVIYGIEQVERGYENIEERLRSLGAHIKRISDGHVIK